MADVPALLIRTDKTISSVTLRRYEDYRDHLEGYIEAVRLQAPGTYEEWTLWVNEEFRLGQFDPATDFNSVASDLAGLGGRIDLLLTGILGPALLTGGADRYGNTLPVTKTGKVALSFIASEAGATIDGVDPIDWPME